MRINENNSARKYMQRHTALTESWCFFHNQVFGRNITGSLSEVTYSVHRPPFHKPPNTN